ncbi:hypothetical protein Tco_0609294 [Tanacetum coccineum]
MWRSKSSHQRVSKTNYNQRALFGGSWSNSDKDEEEKTKDEEFLMAKTSNEGRISIFTVNLKYHFGCYGKIHRIMRRTLVKTACELIGDQQVLGMECGPNVNLFIDILALD